MKEESYKVILEGTVLGGHDRSQVLKNLSSAFKQDPQVTERLLLGKPRIVKKGLNYATAEKYQKALEKMGAASRFEAEVSSVRSHTRKIISGRRHRNNPPTRLTCRVPDADTVPQETMMFSWCGATAPSAVSW